MNHELKNNPEAMYRLLNAIVKQTAEDWWISKRTAEATEEKLKSTVNCEERNKLLKKNFRARLMQSDCEMFFTSKYGDWVSRGLAMPIFERLQKLYIEFGGDIRKYRRLLRTNTMNTI